MTQAGYAESLATKHRPKGLKDYIGNENATKLIEGFVKNKSVPSLILIAGPTGAGKTTLAYIIAKLINEASSFEESGAKEVHCNVDSGVQYARDLVASARFLPAGRNFNVYIMDEFHQLTQQASDVFLKEFETSSKNVWIILTNEPHKLLATIRGRAKIINLEYPDEHDANRILSRICKREKFLIPTKRYRPIFKAIFQASGGDPRSMISALGSFVDIHGKTPKSFSGAQIDKLFAHKSQLDIGFPLVEYILNGNAKAIASNIKGFTYRMDMKFLGYLCSDLLKISESEIATGRTSRGHRLLKVVEKLALAGSKITNTPVIISGPLIYASILQCALYMKKN